MIHSLGADQFVRKREVNNLQNVDKKQYDKVFGKLTKQKKAEKKKESKK